MRPTNRSLTCPCVKMQRQLDGQYQPTSGYNNGHELLNFMNTYSSYNQIL